MYGKEYGLTQPQYMFALWTVRAYIAGYIQPITPRVLQALNAVPEDLRASVLSDMQKHVNSSQKDKAIKEYRDKTLLSICL